MSYLKSEFEDGSLDPKQWLIVSERVVSVKDGVVIKRTYIGADGKHYTSATWVRKEMYKDGDLEVLLELALTEEDYERAAELRDLINLKQ